jgi:hypothetical protein
MKRFSSYFKIIAEKPDTFCSLPESIISLEQRETLKKIPRLAIGEICSIESIPAVQSVLERTSIDAFLPTIVYTGAEYGNWQALLEKLSNLKKIVEKSLRIYCLDPVILGAPSFWWALNGRFMHELNKRFNFYSPCLGCRLYSLAVRIPFCKQIGCMMVISGISSRRSESYTINTSEEVMHYCKTLLSSFGINLIKSEDEKKSIEQEMVSASSDISNICSSCIFKDNYQTLSSSLREQPDNKKYFEQFAIPAVAKIISRALAGKKNDYLHEVMDTLLPGNIFKSKKMMQGSF